LFLIIPSRRVFPTLSASEPTESSLRGRHDPQGQSVAGAIVKVRNDDTGVVTDLTTNEAGSYSSPSLVLGTYTITVEMTGFKSATRPSIRLIGGQTFRQDIALELGEVSEQITVSASAEILNTANADVTHTVDSTFYENLPVVMGADIRLAEACCNCSPDIRR
jgi:hypothetical protein